MARRKFETSQWTTGADANRSRRRRCLCHLFRRSALSSNRHVLDARQQVGWIDLRGINSRSAVEIVGIDAERGEEIVAALAEEGVVARSAVEAIVARSVV